MEIKVNVMIDLSESARSFLSSLAGCMTAPASPLSAFHSPLPPKSDPSIEMPFDAEITQEPEKKEEAKMEQPSALRPPLSGPQAPPAQPVVATDQVLKDYMDLVFKGLIGDDWRELVNTDQAMKVRRAEITRIFKTIAGELGAVKPTLLPQSKRSEFIERLNNITLGDDGRVQYLPF